MLSNYGWTCPQCGGCYAPWVSVCPYCGTRMSGPVYIYPQPGTVGPWLPGPYPSTGDPLPPQIEITCKGEVNG